MLRTGRLRRYREYSHVGLAQASGHITGFFHSLAQLDHFGDAVRQAGLVRAQQYLPERPRLRNHIITAG